MVHVLTKLPPGIGRNSYYIDSNVYRAYGGLSALFAIRAYLVQLSVLSLDFCHKLRARASDFLQADQPVTVFLAIADWHDGHATQIALAQVQDFV